MHFTVEHRIYTQAPIKLPYQLISAHRNEGKPCTYTHIDNIPVIEANENVYFGSGAAYTYF